MNVVPRCRRYLDMSGLREEFPQSWGVAVENTKDI